MNKSIAAAVAFAIFISISSSFAVRLDKETHTALIQRLESVRADLGPRDVSFIPTTLRLADLLADRARLLDMESMEDKKSFSEAAKADRLKAIGLYESVEKQLTDTQRENALLQKSQLLQLVGNVSGSEVVLNQVRRETPPTDNEYLVATEALADIEFARGNYLKSHQLYSELQRSSKRSDFGDYRLAWCEINIGREGSAVQKMESLLSKKNLETGLRKEVSRDVVLFYSRTNFQDNMIAKVKRFSHAEDFESNLKLFAEELKRLGKRKEAALVLNEYLKTADKSEMNATAKADLFESLVHTGQKQEANKVLAEIVGNRCKEDCADIQSTVQRTLRLWANEEAPKLSKEVVESFKTYARMRPLDQTAMLFGIKMAQDADMHQHALTLLSAVIAETKDKNVLENALKAQVVSAEKTKNPAAKEMALRSYLERGQDANLKKDIQIELISAMIENKNWSSAEQLALKVYEQTKDKEVGLLVLDTYNKSNQTEKERQFSLRMSDGNVDSPYYRNYKRLSLEMVQNKLNQNKTEKSDLILMTDIANKSKSSEEKFRALNDSFLVAAKLQDFAALKKIANEMVQVSSSLPPAKKLMALEKRMLVADLELDYATSLNIDRKMDTSKSPAKIFRMALKARLAGTPDLKLEQQILDGAQFDYNQRLWILEQQIASSPRPLALLERNSKVASRSREIHSRLALMCLAKTPIKKMISYTNRTPALKGSLVDVMMKRRQVISKMSESLQLGLRTKIASRSVNSFGQTLDSKIGYIQAIESLQQRNIKDSVSMLVGLNYWIALNQDFVKELNQAKNLVPMSAKNKKTFLQQIDAQIASLNKKITEADAQIQTSWDQEKVEEEFSKALSISHPLQREALIAEAQFWKSATSGRLQSLLDNLLNKKSGASTSGSSLASIYNNLKANPFRKDLAQQLAKEEESRGNYVMSVFISQRDDSLGGI